MSGLPNHVTKAAAERHGVLTRRELVRAGTPSGTITGWLRRGLLESVAHGVYRIPGSPRSPQQAARAVVLRAGAHAKAGPRTSAALHGISGYGFPCSYDAVIPPARRITAVNFPWYPIHARSPDTCILDTIPALSLARTVIELAVHLSEHQLRLLVDDARRRGLQLVWLVQRCDALGVHPGAVNVRRLIDEGVFSAETEGERVMRRSLFLGLDWQLEGQVTDLVPGRRLDVAERLSLMGYEYDGRGHHVLPTDRDADGLRDLEVADEGVLILHITAGMLRNHLAETRERVIRIRERRLIELGRTG